MGRLRDAQLIGSDPQRLKTYLGDAETKALENRLTDKTKYRQFGALGQELGSFLCIFCYEKPDPSPLNDRPW